MIVLRVLSYNGAPAEGPSAQFDELGGTIGRADNNQLVLPDPERTISRIHARVVFRSGGYAVVDNGSNPISVNGQPVGAGREQPLKPGDQIQIGGYALVVSLPASAGSSGDPFSDLFPDAPLGLAAMPRGTARTQPPLGAPGPTPAAWPAPAAAAAAAPAAPARALAPGLIPDDWDLFAPDPVAPAGAAAASGRDDFADFARAGESSIDELFGLGPAAGAELLKPTAPRQPDPAPAEDPWELMQGTAQITPRSRSDHASELNLPMSLPMAAPAPAPAPLPPGAIFSWNDPPRDGRVVTLPGIKQVAAPPGVPARSAEAVAPTPAPAASPASDTLLQALLEGLAVPGLRLHALTPETLRLVGQLLHESMRGAVELLVARAALKREMRAEMTMIVQRENNPLKFSPTVDVALQHLLGPPTAGFMPAAPAVRDAFDDLRAHQLGVMAGMRAALDGVLDRFDPKQLEAKLTKRSAIDSLIPATRKARLWEAFQQLFGQLQAEAQDDFDELFGKAFLRAYNDQLDRLQREPGPH